jgi:hypothetical protein
MFFHGIQTGFRNAFDAEPFTDFFCRSISVVVRAFAFDLSDLWGLGLHPLTAIYRYFAPERQRMEARFNAERTAYRQTKRKIGRNRL